MESRLGTAPFGTRHFWKSVVSHVPESRQAPSTPVPAWSRMTKIRPSGVGVVRVSCPLAS
jgi:hypothetical protein